MTTSRNKPASNGDATPAFLDFHHTGPGTLAGQYMRMFWQPVYHSADLPVGRAKPIKIMNVDYTLYRGNSGQPYLTDFRCPHRGTQLSAGWVEGDAVRCRYHGWKFDKTGQCVEQPAEPKPFADRVKIKPYPCQDYLGLIFAYLGEGDAPPLPRYPTYENFEGILEHDSYVRGCNYFNNMDNAGDHAHSGFAHRNNPGSFDGLTSSPTMECRESKWGITIASRWPDQMRVSQYGMPNVYNHKAQPTDPSVAIFREFMAWWVPIDDESHWQFTVARVELSPDKARQYLERRDQRVAKRTNSSMELALKVLRGEIEQDDVTPESTDFVRFQDDVVQVGQGTIADHQREILGASDRVVVLRRRMWARELRALAEGKPLTQWVYDVNDLNTSRGELWEQQYAEQSAHRA
jgi:5,5'-dehydrodivanillate O-demethylase